MMLTLLGLSGCSTLKYLLQAGKGQMAIMNRGKPLEEVIADVKTPPRIRRLLREVSSIKDFGESRELKRTQNYSEYVALDREAAVWVVSASQRLEFKSKQWVFPIVGHVPYLGWFDRGDAEDFRRQLEQEGYDADLRGAAAYSTIGWFKDPILSSMIPPKSDPKPDANTETEGDPGFGALVNVVLHESVHATYYIQGQAYFDESLAAFVGDRLTTEYLKAKGLEDAPDGVAYQKREAAWVKYRERMHVAYVELDQVYRSAMSESQKLAKKEEILGALMKQYSKRERINNATLIDFKEYNTGIKEFEELFAACGSDWKRFWQVIFKIKKGSFSRPNDPEIAPLILSLKASCR